MPRTQKYRTQKYLEKRELPKALSLKPEAGPNIALHALSTARNVALFSLSYFIQLHYFSDFCDYKIACVTKVEEDF